jgi:hypothetical protein
MVRAPVCPISFPIRQGDVMTCPSRSRRHLFLWAFLAVVVLGLGVTLSLDAQTTGFNEREVRSEPIAGDKGTVWTLDFKFKDPRVITVNVPGRGTRVCWYMWYQVINRGDEPRMFIPSFELVTLDHPGAFQDELLLSVQEAIKQQEDPTGYQKIKNSVTISSEPIPPSNEKDSFPKAITGVAIWDASRTFPKKGDEREKQLNETTRFSIFVSGLSNGWVLVDPVPAGPNTAPIVRRKTLQLNFKREGGRFGVSSKEILWEAPSKWIYRVSPLRIPDQVPKAGAWLQPSTPWLASEFSLKSLRYHHGS